MTDIYTQLVGGAPSATAALANALAAKGTTLADAYNAWATAQLTGGYTIGVLQGVKPEPYTTTVYGNEGGHNR